MDNHEISLKIQKPSMDVDVGQNKLKSIKVVSCFKKFVRGAFKNKKN